MCGQEIGAIWMGGLDQSRRAAAEKEAAGRLRANAARCAETTFEV